MLLHSVLADATSLAFVEAKEAAACPHAAQHGHVQQVST